jgi:uncharacterized membrane protein YqjE
MEGEATPSIPLTGALRRVLSRLLAIGENRVLLLLTEIEEERDRVLSRIFLGLATAALSMLGIIAWSAAIVIGFWQTNPIVVLIILGAAYVIAAVLLLRKLLGRRIEPPLSGTMEQLQKDRACLK